MHSMNRSHVMRYSFCESIFRATLIIFTFYITISKWSKYSLYYQNVYGNIMWCMICIQTHSYTHTNCVIYLYVIIVIIINSWTLQHCNSNNSTNHIFIVCKVRSTVSIFVLVFFLVSTLDSCWYDTYYGYTHTSHHICYHFIKLLMPNEESWCYSIAFRKKNIQRFLLNYFARKFISHIETNKQQIKREQNAKWWRRGWGGHKWENSCTYHSMHSITNILFS